MNEPKVICTNCARQFPIWDIHEKKVKCPYCDVSGNNPYYVKPKKIDPKTVFVKR